MNKSLDGIYRVMAWLGGALFVGMTVVVCVNIVARYFFNYSFSWSEEVARYMLVWMTMIGAAMGVRKWGHFRLEFLEHSLGSGARFALRLLAFGCAAAIGALLLWQGLIWLPITDHQLATATQVPMSWIYASLPMAGLLILLFVVEAAVALLAARKAAAADAS